MCVRGRVAASAVYVKHIRTVGSNMCQMLDGSENVFRVMLMAKYRFARNYIFACLSMISESASPPARFSFIFNLTFRPKKNFRMNIFRSFHCATLYFM